MDLRELSDPERRLLEFLLTRSFPGSDVLRVQAETVKTGGSSCDCGCPSFSLHPDKSLPVAADTKHMPSDAHGTDLGGNSIGVLLFVDDGYLAVVEVYNYEGSRFDGIPDPGALSLSEWSAPDDRGGPHLLNP